MPSYSNGRIPDSLLVRFKSGWNATDGNWHHSLSPATYARHKALVSRALNRTGRVLAISLGWSAYRPYDAQVLAQRVWGNGAAQPGTSSHGGFWEGRQTLAMDYGNWAWVYENHGGYAAFAEDCRAVGLSPGMIMRTRGYPDEPWHVIDLNPWSPVPADLDVEDFDDMATKDEIKDALYEVLVGTGLGPGKRNHWDSLKFIADLAAAAHPSKVWAFPVQAQDDKGNPIFKDGKPVMFPARGYLASTAGQIAAGSAEVNEEEVAAALAPLLTKHVGALSDEDVSRLATATADEWHRRAPDVDEDAIIAGILAGLPDTATPVEIAKAVRDEFASNPLR